MLKTQTNVDILNQTDGLYGRRTEALSWLLCARKTTKNIERGKKQQQKTHFETVH